MPHGDVSQDPGPSRTEIKRNYTTCNCNWDKGRCKQVWEQIHDNLNDDHVWKTNGYKFRINHQKKPSIKSLAFQASGFQHLKFSEEQELKYQSGFRIAHHHFSENLLKTHPTRLTLLTREQALSLDQNLQINSTGFADKVNSVCSPLGTNYFEEQADELKYNNLYVVGPLVSYDTAFNISKGVTTSSTKKLAASKFQNLPKPISLEPAQQHQLSVSFTDD